MDLGQVICLNCSVLSCTAKSLAFNQSDTNYTLTVALTQTHKSSNLTQSVRRKMTFPSTSYSINPAVYVMGSEEFSKNPHSFYLVRQKVRFISLKLDKIQNMMLFLSDYKMCVIVDEATFSVWRRRSSNLWKESPVSSVLTSSTERRKARPR